MRIYKDTGTISGFRYEAPLGKSHFVSHAGEYWSSRSHFIPEHRHEVWEFLYQMQGGTTWKEGTRGYSCNADELLICPPGLSHGMAAKAKGEFRICFFGSDLSGCERLGLDRLLRQDRLLVVKEAHLLRSHLRQLIEEIAAEHKLRAEAIRLTMRQILLMLSRLLDDSRLPTWSHKRLSVERIKTLLREHPGDAWKLDDLARVAGYSPGYFASLFRRETGMSPHGFLQAQRIESAVELLRQGSRPVTEIALEMGFSSSQHFATAFRKATGHSPRDWRNQSLS